MQETMEKRANRTVGKSRQKDFFAVLLFFFLLPYTCSSVVRAGQEKTVETIVPVSGRTVRMQSGSDVRTMTEEAFLIGALAAVIPAEYEPEALKAQAVILRSSCVAGGHLEETVLENGTTGAAQESISQNSVSAVEPRIIDSNSGFSYLDKAQRKRLWGEQADVLEERCREAVRASSGYVLEWQGAAVSAPFFRLSAGRTRSGTELFGQESDWCKSIACPVDEAAEDFLQEKSMKTERFFGMLEAEGVSVEKDAPKLVLTRDSAGYVLNVRAGRSSIEGERFRQLFELPSSCFFLEEQGGKMVITTKGIGHGIGLDQYYANALAKQGASAEEILELFFPGLLKKYGIKRLNCAQTKPEHRKQERMSVMRRKRTGGKNSAYRREKAIMTASVVLVLAAMTVTGISVYRNHQKSQEEEQHIVDFSKLEEETQSPVAQAQNPSAQNVTGSDKDSGELDYDPYYAQKDKDLSAPAKTGGESGAEAAGEQETGSQPTEEPKNRNIGYAEYRNEAYNSDGGSNELASGGGQANAADADKKANGTTASQDAADNQDEALAASANIAVQESQLSFGESSKLAWPIAGNVLLNYSMDKTIYFPTLQQYKYNPSIVISAAEGTGVACAADGIVESVYEDAQTGQTVVMRLGGGYELTYGQLQEVTVEEGDYVETGAVIGHVAEPTKYYSVEGSNVYFKLTKDGEAVNPLDYLG